MLSLRFLGIKFLIYSLRILRSLKFVYKLRKKISDVNCRDSLYISHDKSQFVANYLLSRFNKVILIQTLESDDLKKTQIIFN